MIRLQPEDLDMRTATLMHEAGHLGATRGRDVEEAIADLTRRALLLRWLDLDPAAAAPLVPWLLQGLGAGAERAASLPEREAAGVYARATRLALALLRATPLDATSPGAAARRCAAAARTGRSLPTAEVRALADRLLRPEDFSRARAEELTGTVLPALQTAATATGVRPESRALLLALAQRLESTSRRWDTLLEDLGPAASDPGLARILFAILADEDRAATRSHLEAWEERARRAGDRAGRDAALSRLAALLASAGEHRLAEATAMTLVLEASDAASAAFGVTLLHRRADPAHEPLTQFLDLAPMLRHRSPSSAAVRAYALAALGDPAAAAAEFSRAAATDAGWSLQRSWAAALEASGRPGRAAALLDADARAARRQGDSARAGASLLSAALLVEEGREQRAQEAARLLEAGPASPDHALALAATAATRAGRTAAARRFWRRLLDRVPQSDYAAEARAALEESGQDQPKASPPRTSAER